MFCEKKLAQIAEAKTPRKQKQVPASASVSLLFKQQREVSKVMRAHPSKKHAPAQAFSRNRLQPCARPVITTKRDAALPPNQ